MFLTHVTHIALIGSNLGCFLNINKQTKTYWIVIKKIYFSKLVIDLLNIMYAYLGGTFTKYIYENGQTYEPNMD